MLHIDLFGPTRNKSLSGNIYVFVIVDNFTRYLWVLFLKSKVETIYKFVKFSKKVENKKKFFFIINIMNDHGNEFISNLFETFVKKKDTTITFQHLELLIKWPRYPYELELII